MNTGPRVRVIPGTGVVIRSGPVVAVILGEASAPVPSLVALMERLGGVGDDLEAQVFSRELLTRFAQPGAELLPPVGAVALLGDGLAVVLHGDVACRINEPDGEVTLRGRDAAVSLNVVRSGPFSWAAIHADGEDPGEIAPFHHLEAGVVPGAAAIVVPEPTGDASGVTEPFDQPDPADLQFGSPGGGPGEPATAEMSGPIPVEPADETVSAQPRAPLPTAAEEASTGLTHTEVGASRGPDAASAAVGAPADVVDGIECAEGHFNHPYALQCSVCGRSLLDGPRRTVAGPRQPLGTITFDDGTSYVLTSNYVIGREPEQDAAVQANLATAIRVEDPDHQISRVHADIRLGGWDVQIVDRDSANGTYVLPPEGSDWQRLLSEEPRTISPGTRVAIGRKVLTYEW